MIGAIVILFSCQLLGEVVARALALPIPGPVVGLVLMIFLLFIRKEIPKELETVSNTLLKHLSLLFVPAGVGVLLHLNRVSSELLPLSAALIGSGVATIAVTALVFRLVTKALGEKSDEGEEQP